METKEGELLNFVNGMSGQIKYNENYKQLESWDKVLEVATEYIPRHYKRTRPSNLTWVGAFLHAVSEGLTVREACSVSGIAYSSVFAERDHNPDFKEAWEEAARCGTDVLAGRARERALEKSDLLMMFLLKARQPETYNEKYQAQKGSSIAIQINHHYPQKDSAPTSMNVSRETLEIQADSPDSDDEEGEESPDNDVTPRKD